MVPGKYIVRIITYNFLDHVHDLLFHEIQTLCVSRRGPTDDIVDFDVVIFFTDTATIHSIGELDEDGVLLHDALNVLTADTDNSLVVLVRHMERNGRWHLLLDKVETILGSLILGTAHVDVEVVLIESVKDDLHVAYLDCQSLPASVINIRRMTYSVP